MSVAIKLFKKIIRDRLVALLEANKLITESQYGFRRSIFSLTNLLDFFTDVYTNWDVRMPYDSIYLDFHKAFDAVPHNWTISKLQSHRIGEHLRTWIREWLSNRLQSVLLMEKHPTGYT